MSKTISAEKQTERFIAAVKAMEARNRVAAFVVIDPADKPEPWTHGHSASLHNHGRYVISYPPRGKGEQRVHAIGWLPGQTSADVQRHHGHASGYGYDKATAAMGGAHFWNPRLGIMDKLDDQGLDHRRQLEEAGYIVIQAC